ncbi:MAG TPA: HD domain-containing phosphohydrolase [Bryobacteraceae bacterium]|jgi:response regulator RpfG family c-di-GMP phosphodiesterase|nr:HD domain-containing phosphohydrolase [Bryobacteraceae bacterium]
MLPNGERTVVVVDDDESMRFYLTETLTGGGYECRAFPDGRAALGWLASGEERADLLLSDINMPGMSGLDLLRTVKVVSPGLPFILLSGACDLPMAQSALRAGATDYLLKPVRPADLLGIITKHVDVMFSEQLEAVKRALRQSLTAKQPDGSSYAGLLLPIFDGLGFKRFETLQHSQRVAAFALLIARDLDLGPGGFRALETGSLLHDIGKAGIPHNVLMKPGKLNDAEWVIMKMHPQLGMDLLSGVPGLEREAGIVYSHHESFDGKGYPRQLSGGEIPLNARIFSVADTLDALTSDRSYRSGKTLPEARAEIHRVSGTQFDPDVLKLFDRVGDREFEAVRDRFPDTL